MTDLSHPHPADDPLAAQLAARDAASRDDAAVLAPLRTEAAARALGLPTLSHDGRGDAKSPPVPGAEHGPPPPPDTDAPSATTDRARAEPAKPFPPAGVIVPSGGPARVTSGVLAAAAAQRPRPERPLMELRPTVLATDIDRIGDQLVVMKDRLELRDRHGGLRRTLALADIDDVVVQRRLTSAVLVVSSRTATDLVIKGLRPDAADSARETILQLRPEEVPALGDQDERALMRAIVELHRAGVLDDTELADKTALVARMSGRSRRP